MLAESTASLITVSVAIIPWLILIMGVMLLDREGVAEASPKAGFFGASDADNFLTRNAWTYLKQRAGASKLR